MHLCRSVLWNSCFRNFQTISRKKFVMGSIFFPFADVLPEIVWKFSEQLFRKTPVNSCSVLATFLNHYPMMLIKCFAYLERWVGSFSYLFVLPRKCYQVIKCNYCGDASCKVNKIFKSSDLVAYTEVVFQRYSKQSWPEKSHKVSRKTTVIELFCVNFQTCNMQL